ncbi:MAG: hypothetical protein V8R91_21640 [Butyricimonas faecihominis]
MLPKTPEQIIGNGERSGGICGEDGNYRLSGNFGNPMTGDNWQLPNSYHEAYANYAGRTIILWGNGHSLENDGYGYIPSIQDSLNPFYNNSTNWWKQVLRPEKLSMPIYSLREDGTGELSCWGRMVPRRRNYVWQWILAG